MNSTTSTPEQAPDPIAAGIQFQVFITQIGSSIAMMELVNSYLEKGWRVRDGMFHISETGRVSIVVENPRHNFVKTPA